MERERRRMAMDLHVQTLVHHVTGSGDLTGGAVWATTHGTGAGAPDGMKIDSCGNLHCCGPGGVHVFDASGRPPCVLKKVTTYNLDEETPK